MTDRPDQVELEIEELYHELREAVESARQIRPILWSHDRNIRRLEQDIRKLRQGRAAEAPRKGAA